MLYSRLVDFYEEIEKTTKKLEKTSILANLYKECDDEDLSMVVLLGMGVVYNAGEQELGVATGMVKRVILDVCSISEEKLVKTFKEMGDLGNVAEHLIQDKKESLSVQDVFNNLRSLPSIEGKGSQEKKISVIVDILKKASKREAKYIVRTVLAEMRIGVAAGIVRDAIAKTFEQDKKKVEDLYNVLGDYGKVAELAKKGKMKATITVGSPIRVMLSDSAPDLKSALDKFEHPAIESKYDGFRVAVHIDSNMIKLFSRRLEDVTNQFPDIVKSVKNVIARQCIVEGEVLAIDCKTGKPKPFQVLSRRIQRKYDIEKITEEIPVQVNLFDLIYYDGESWMEKPLVERWKKLKSIVKETSQLKLADHIETSDFSEANKFYRNAINAGNEGVIVKNMDAHYQPGRRVGFWLKVKEILEPLDLVVVGAEWGEGKRANWLGSLILAARSGQEFIEVGRMASGLTEQQMEELTKTLKRLIIEEHGKIVKIKPEIVIEIGYEEIQRSPKYQSGYALRFPRLLRIRTAEKRPGDANTIKDIDRLFKQQKRRR